MLYRKLCTKYYTPEYSFEFKGNTYLVHSIVRLTNNGRKYLGAARDEVILTEVFVNHNGTKCWKYVFKSNDLSIGVTDASTDIPPDELLEEVLMAASEGYSQREVFGRDAPSYKSGRKITKKDWEIPEVRNSWITLIIVVFAASIFKDWYVQWTIRLAAGWIFGLYRKSYVNAYTIYQHDEDMEIQQKKNDILYNFKKKEVV